MSKRRRPARKSLVDLLPRYEGRRTVLGVAIPVLAAQIAALRAEQSFPGLSSKEIESGFRELCGRYIHSQFHSTYIDRRLGQRGFLVLENRLYRFRPELLVGVSLSDLGTLHDRLVNSLRDAAEQRRAVIQRLESACNLPEEQITERRHLVEEYIRQFL